MVIASVGLMMTTIGVLSLSGELPMNRVIGISVSSVCQSERHWEAGHRAAAPVNIGFGTAVQIVGGLIAVQSSYTLVAQSLIGSAWAVVATGAFVAWRLAAVAVTDLP
ncbi:MAG: SdpI family protein [Actinobacteria bacterium]|nr:SdpI family protein [Actinomycetota bacterium]